MTETQTAALQAIATRFQLTPETALDVVLAEFAPSTPEELVAQRDRRRDASTLYLKTVTDDPFAQELARSAWNRGFSAGWRQYQLRHDALRRVFERTTEPPNDPSQWMGR